MRVTLRGCATNPVGSYLKGLGVLRLVAEQRDPAARGHWSGEGFVLDSALDEAALLDFFLEDYRPTPVTNPWNADGGYGLGKRAGAKAEVDALRATGAARLRSYRAVIEAVLVQLERFAPEPLDRKVELLQALRSGLPDDGLAWLDAVMVLTEDGFAPFTLFGVGGNDGSQDFSKAFLSALASAMDLRDGSPTASSSAWLEGSLFAVAVPGLPRESPGQFDPAATGGLNAVAGREGSAATNPWDFMLTVEGGLLFAAAATRRLQGGRTRASFPFCVEATAGGYASSAQRDEGGTRSAELWLPLWTRGATLEDVAALFREGRATLGGAEVRDGTDFALAVGRFGVDRGIDAFERFGLFDRNGKNYYAVPLGPWPVQGNPSAALITASLRAWIQSFHKAVDSKAPASLQRAGRSLDEALLQVAQRGTPEDVLRMLVSLSGAEWAVRRSGWTERIRPVPHLDGRAWGERLRGLDSIELRLAAALAGPDLRRRSMGVQRGSWSPHADPGRTWTEAGLVRNLLSTLHRQEIESTEPRPIPAHGTDLADLCAFLAGDVDESAIGTWGLALSLLDGCAFPAHWRPCRPPALFAVVAPVFHREELNGQRLHATPGVLEHLGSGHGSRALELALRRLRACGHTPRLQPWHPTPSFSRRCAAALAFPLSSKSLRELRRSVAEESTPEHNDALDA